MYYHKIEVIKNIFVFHKMISVYYVSILYILSLIYIIYLLKFRKQKVEDLKKTHLNYTRYEVGNNYNTV